MKRFIFPDPLDATCKLQPDSMAQPILGVADTHPVNGAPCQSFNVPSTVPNQNGASLTIQKNGFIPVVLHGILDTVTPGGGGFDCDVFRLQAGYEVNFPQPLVFDSNGGTGTIQVTTAPGSQWAADPGATAEDWVTIPGGSVNGTGTKTFTVKSAAQLPQVPLPRSGFIIVFETSSGLGATLARVQVLQK